MGAFYKTNALVDCQWFIRTIVVQLGPPAFQVHTLQTTPSSAADHLQLHPSTPLLRTNRVAHCSNRYIPKTHRYTRGIPYTKINNICDYISTHTTQPGPQITRISVTITAARRGCCWSRLVQDPRLPVRTNVYL